MADSSPPISRESKPAIPDWAQILIWCGALLLLLMISYVIYMALLDDSKVSAFGKVATLLLVGLGAFIGLMGVLSFTSNYIGILDDKQPFGLPEGTVRAILTIAFIVLVGVLSGYLVTNNSGRSAFSSGTRIPLQSYDTEKAASDAADVARKTFGNEGLIAVIPNAGATKIEVVFYPRVDNRLSEDIAKQTLTMISTILAAMIGFYFAARAEGGSEGGDEGVRSALISEVRQLIDKGDFQKKINALTEDSRKKNPATEKKSLLDEINTQLSNAQTDFDKANDLSTIKVRLAKVPELEDARTKLKGMDLRLENLRRQLGEIEN